MSGCQGCPAKLNTRIETCPISGTIRRGRDALEDAANIRALLNSEKEESELTMCTDVDRNDNIQPCKTSNPRKRIDGFASLLDAFVVLEQNRENYLNLI